jgi:hypothetical protein
MIPMSKKNDRAWFVCPQWAALVSGHYATDAEAARALKLDPKVLARLRGRTPVAKSTVRRALHVLVSRHVVAAPIDDLVVDTRSS